MPNISRISQLKSYHDQSTNEHTSLLPSDRLFSSKNRMHFRKLNNSFSVENTNSRISKTGEYSFLRPKKPKTLKSVRSKLEEAQIRLQKTIIGGLTGKNEKAENKKPSRRIKTASNNDSIFLSAVNYEQVLGSNIQAIGPTLKQKIEKKLDFKKSDKKLDKAIVSENKPQEVDLYIS